MNAFDDESLDDFSDLESVIAAAVNLQEISPDWRPAVVEAVETRCRSRRRRTLGRWTPVWLTVCGSAIGAFLALTVAGRFPPQQHRIGMTGDQMERAASNRAQATGTPPAWALVEVFDQWRRPSQSLIRGGKAR